MAKYTTLILTEISDIVSHYTIGAALDIEDIPGGYGNSNFKLTTTEGTFLLKICDEKNLRELQQQVALLEHLHKHAYPTAYPIVQKNGKSLYVSSNYNVMIYPFLNGSTPLPSEQVLMQIGAALAKLHGIPVLPELPRFPMGQSQIDPFLIDVRDTKFATHPFITWLESELEWIKPELDKSLPKGLLHGDMFLDNTLFHEGKLVAILDFEEVCHDTLLIDIGMTIIGCCYTTDTPIGSAFCIRFP